MLCIDPFFTVLFMSAWCPSCLYYFDQGNTVSIMSWRLWSSKHNVHHVFTTLINLTLCPSCLHYFGHVSTVSMISALCRSFHRFVAFIALLLSVNHFIAFLLSRMHLLLGVLAVHWRSFESCYLVTPAWHASQTNVPFDWAIHAVTSVDLTLSGIEMKGNHASLNGGGFSLQSLQYMRWEAIIHAWYICRSCSMPDCDHRAFCRVFTLD